MFTVNVENGNAFNSGRRRSSVLLRRSLIRSDHQPFSVWPQTRPGSESRFNVTSLAGDSSRPRRVSIKPDSRLPSTDETEMQSFGTGL